MRAYQSVAVMRSGEIPLALFAAAAVVARLLAHALHIVRNMLMMVTSHAPLDQPTVAPCWPGNESLTPFSYLQAIEANVQMVKGLG